MNKGEVNGCLCNVTNDEEIEAMFKDAVSYYSNLNGVINNAGLGGESLLENMSNEAWDLVMNVTLNGAMKIMRAAIPVLKETQGVIINNASVLGWRAQAGQSHYAAAKAGVMALTRCVALETVNHGIRINAVAPSLAMNPHLSKTSSDELIAELESKEAFGRGAEPWEIANIILFLASDLSSYMTGEVISASSQRA
jgi:3-oxoacyl-[acyl-carrier protein] reductase